MPAEPPANLPIVKRPRLVLFSGNTARPSGSRRLAATLGEAISAHLDADMLALDLVDAGKSFGSVLKRGELPTKAKNVIWELENADALVVVTPVHNGSYPGLFKHLVDFLDRSKMAGKPVLLGASGSSRRHASMVENQLMPLFGFFQAQISAYSVAEIVGNLAEENSDPSAIADRIGLAAKHFAHMINLGLSEPASGIDVSSNSSGEAFSVRAGGTRRG